MDLFDLAYENNKKTNRPLADRMRPQTLSDYVGQEHLLEEGKPLRRMIQSDRLHSMIFYGPPGTGKTTLAHIISEATNSIFESISAVTTGIKDIREIVKRAEDNLTFYNKRTILFIDEIHRFNKGQQDALLPFVENGVIILIGATTENPYFEVNSALLSRSQIMRLNALEEEDIKKIVIRAIHEDILMKDKNIVFKDYVLDNLARLSNGDARMALNILEIAVFSTEEKDGKIIIDLEDLENSGLSSGVLYDKDGDEHYDTISAFIKSMRGSDVDASLFYLAKMIESGEDPKFISRRLIIFASEDIGNANPLALGIAVDCFNAIHIIGMPEARIVLAQTTIYMASSIKSNSAYKAIDLALEDVRKIGNHNIPFWIRDSHYGGAKNFGHGEVYKYPHDYKNHYVKQDYLPEELRGKKYYTSSDQGYEKRMREFLDYLKED